MRRIESANRNVLLQRIATEAARFQHHRSPEILHPCQMVRPIYDLCAKDRTEHRICANGFVKLLHNLRDERIVDAASQGIRHLACTCLRDMVRRIHGFDSFKMHFICIV